MSDTGIRILLADDHRIIRDGLRSLLEKQPDIEVVAEAGDGRTTLQLAQETAPDVVIMDIAMPDLNGIEVTRQLIASVPEAKVLALSMYSDRRFITSMLSAGASGYLPKDCAFEEVVTAIRTVTAGQTYLGSSIIDTVVDSYVQNLRKGSSDPNVLTTRQREVTQLLAEGKSVKEIARCLSLSVKTIETYRSQIMKKLNVHSIAEITKYAIREGFTSLET